MDAPRLFHSSSRQLGAIINPAPTDTMIGDPGTYVFAQPNELLAHAYALKYGRDIIKCTSQQISGDESYTWFVAIGREAFFGSLAHKDGARGGFIYEVERTAFRPITGPGGGMEWVSEISAPVIGSPRFVSLEQVMDKGIQIFIAEDKPSSVFPAGKNPHEVIFERIASGKIAWLNHETGNNPQFPINDARRPAGRPAILSMLFQAERLKPIIRNPRGKLRACRGRACR